MARKQKKDNRVHGLVIFKGRMAQFKSVEAKTVQKLEDVDQENKIKISSEITPYGACYRYSLLLINESSAPVTEFRVRLKLPNLFDLTRHYPPSLILASSKIETGETQINFELSELNGESKQQINFYTSPTTIETKGEITAAASYINNKGFIRAINVKPKIIQNKSIKFEEKTIPSEDIGIFLRRNDINKAMISLGVGVKKKPNLALFFNHITQLIKLHNFKLIAKDEKNRIAWYFAQELESNEDILVIGQIVANKVEFLAATVNPTVLTTLMINLSIDFKKSITSTGYVAIDQIYNLECKFCGNILPSLPKKGDSIICQKCNNEQVIW